jgi:hypothetical protein
MHNADQHGGDMEPLYKEPLELGIYNFVLQFCTHFDTSILLALFNPKDEGNVFF